MTVRGGKIGGVGQEGRLSYWVAKLLMTLSLIKGVS
jgi:hypothetical protein